MSHNTFGHLFRFTTFGESHGPAIGCVVDGCPPGIALSEADIQVYLDRRKPGQSKFVSQRKEPDTVRGGLILTNGVTNANFYSMVDIIFIFNQFSAVQRILRGGSHG